MLKAIKAKRLQAGNARFAIIASQYNGRYVNAMLRAARAEETRTPAIRPNGVLEQWSIGVLKRYVESHQGKEITGGKCTVRHYRFAIQRALRQCDAASGQSGVQTSRGQGSAGGARAGCLRDSLRRGAIGEDRLRSRITHHASHLLPRRYRLPGR